MRSDVSAYSSEDIVRVVTLELYQGDTVADILNGTASAPVDLSDLATRISMDQSTLNVSMSYNEEFLECSDQVKLGHLLVVRTDGLIRFIGIVSSIGSFREERGDRSMSITARTREGVGEWKTRFASSAVFPLGTSLGSMLESITQDLMALDPVEYSFPAMSQTTPHGNAQFIDEQPWKMIETVLETGSFVPYVNVLNQVKAYSKDITKLSSIPIDIDRIISIDGTSESLNYKRVRLKWLDPKLQKSTQQSQLLYSTAMTAGWFDIKQEEKTWFSEDRTQRAENTTMRIIDSVNANSFVTVADEEYEQKDEYHGEIKLTTRSWVPGLLLLATANIIANGNQPDGVSGTQTVPIGKALMGASIASVYLIMLSMGVGRYEIWGSPYDWVHAKNTTVALLSDQPDWALGELELENDLVANEQQATALATNALVYETAKQYGMSVQMVDDPRIEVGDILKFPDGVRMLVLGFSNDFSRPAQATISVQGVRA